MPHLQLVSLSGTKFDDEAYEILLPTLNGEIGILPDHMPLISVATAGVVTLRRQAQDNDEQLEYFAISGGVVEVLDNTVRVLADEVDHADTISEAEAEAAHERALKLKAEATDQISLEHAQELVDRTAVRLQVAGLKRRSRRA